MLLSLENAQGASTQQDLQGTRFSYKKIQLCKFIQNHHLNILSISQCFRICVQKDLQKLGALWNSDLGVWQCRWGRKLTRIGTTLTGRISVNHSQHEEEYSKRKQIYGKYYCIFKAIQAKNQGKTSSRVHNLVHYFVIIATALSYNPKDSSRLNAYHWLQMGTGYDFCFASQMSSAMRERLNTVTYLS